MLAKLRSRTRGDLETQLFLSDLESVLLEPREPSPRGGTISAAAPPPEVAYADSVASTADHPDAPTPSDCSIAGDTDDVHPEPQRSVKDHAASLLVRWFACPSLRSNHGVTRVPSSHQVRWMLGSTLMNVHHPSFIQMHRASSSTASTWSECTAASDSDGAWMLIKYKHAVHTIHHRFHGVATPRPCQQPPVPTTHRCACQAGTRFSAKDMAP